MIAWPSPPPRSYIWIPLAIHSVCYTRLLELSQRYILNAVRASSLVASKNAIRNTIVVCRSGNGFSFETVSMAFSRLWLNSHFIQLYYTLQAQARGKAKAKQHKIAIANESESESDRMGGRERDTAST